MTCQSVEPTVEVVLIWGPDEEDDRLVLTPDCPTGDDGLWWHTLVLPEWVMRNTTAPPSAWVPGNVLLAATRDSASMTLGIGATGASTAALATQKALVEAAVGQHPLTIQVEITDDGETTVVDGPWDALPTVPAWGAVTPQDALLHAAETVLAITVNPPGSP